MRKTFLTFLVFLIMAFFAFLVFSSNGFLGGEIGKAGSELSTSIDKAVNQKVSSLDAFTVKTEEKAKPDLTDNALKEDSATEKFFAKLKTATPEELAQMVLDGFKPAKANKEGEPPLVYMARYNNNAEVYNIMLNIGSSVAQTNNKGENALKVAIERGAPIEIIRILYANQEELDAKARQEKIKQGPGPTIISSYYPSLENIKGRRR